MFTYTSKPFNTLKDLEEERKKLIQALCDHIGVKREEFKLQQGHIILHGQLPNGNYVPITNRMSDFKERVKGTSFPMYRLYIQVHINRKGE